MLTRKNILFNPFWLLLFIPLLAYWQLATGAATMKWDIMDQAFPWRYFTGEALRHGVLPFWNPYLGHGYPAHADPQSGVWYPFTWIFGLLLGYNALAIQWEWLIHIFIAGAGMYFLARTLKLGKPASLLAALGYQLSGFMVGNAQHLQWIIGAAWLPVILASFIRLLRTAGWRETFCLVFALYMQLTGGYPALFVIAQYLVLFLLVRHIWIRARIKSWQGTGRVFARLAAAYGLLLLAGAGYLYSFWLALPEITRHALDHSALLEGSFTLPSLVSLVSPLLTLSGEVTYGTDISMRNLYVGIFPLLMAFFALLAWRDKRVRWLWLLALVSLALALGQDLPFRSWAARLPLLDRFRFPAIFRVFTILSLLLLGGIGLERLGKSGKRERKILAIIVAVGSAGFILSGLLGGAFSPAVPWPREGYMQWLAGAEWHLLALTQVMWWLPVPLIVLASLLWFRKKLVLLVLLAASMEGVVFTQLQAPATILSETDTRYTDRLIAALPKGFPVPDAALPVSSYGDTGRLIYPVWYNLGALYKVPSPQAYNLFVLRAWDFLKTEPVYSKYLLNMPLAFLEDDTLNTPPAIRFTRFTPREIALTVERDKPGKLVIQQNLFDHGWHAQIDGRETRIQQAYGAFISLRLPAGWHEVRVYYKVPGLTLLWWVSVALFLFLAAASVWSVKDRLQHSR